MQRGKNVTYVDRVNYNVPVAADCQVVSFVLYQPKVIENWHIFCDFHIFYSPAPSYVACTRLKWREHATA